MHKYRTILSKKISLQIKRFQICASLHRTLPFGVNLVCLLPLPRGFLIHGSHRGSGDDRRQMGYPKPQDWQMINASGQVGD